MKLLVTTFTLVLTLAGSTFFSFNELIKASYFDGKWEVLIKDTPQGDATIPMRFETEEGVTKGYFTENGSETEKPMSSVTVSGEVLTGYFNITGYDVYISLKKVDDENASGSLMDMFTAQAKRVK